jgi:hypothetical protein
MLVPWKYDDVGGAPPTLRLYSVLSVTPRAGAAKVGAQSMLFETGMDYVHSTSNLVHKKTFICHQTSEGWVPSLLGSFALG